MRKYSLLFMVAIAIAAFSSCKKDDDTNPDNDTPGNNIPSTYNFDNVDYGGQTVRLLLTDMLMEKIEALEEAGATAVTKAELEAIYDNTGNYFTDISTGKDLSSKIKGGKGGAADLQMRAWFDTLETRSAMYAGSPQAVTTADNIYLPEMIEKTIMGHVFYHQALNYMYESVPTADNSNVTPGKGTSMQHNWDEAFGYFGAARNYPAYSDEEISANPSQKDADGDGKIDPQSEKNFYFGRYAGSRDKSYTVFTSTPTNFTADIFNGFTEGRYYIGAKEYGKRDEARTKVSTAWDKIIAASAIKYAKDCKNVINNPEQLKGKWAELKLFTEMTQLNSNTKLGSGTFADLKGWIGNKPADLTEENVDKIISTLTAAYEF